MSKCKLDLGYQSRLLSRAQAQSVVGAAEAVLGEIAGKPADPALINLAELPYELLAGQRERPARLCESRIGRVRARPRIEDRKLNGDEHPAGRPQIGVSPRV